MTEGLTTTGLVVDTTDETLTKIETDELANIDAGLDTSPEEPLGQINGIYASDRSALAQLLQAIYGALDPDNAEGQQLDVVGALRGNKRKPASSTRVVATCSLDKGNIFTTATLDANGNVTANGDLVAQIAGHPEFVFVCIGYNLAVGGFVRSTTIDTTAASGTASYDLVFESTQTGAIACNAGTLTVISPSVSGWNSVTNAADAYSLGAAIETDAAYRLRQLAELVPTGGGTFESLRRSIGPIDGSGNGVAGVISAQLLVNDTDTTDANGLPPHSFEAVIWDGSSPAATPADIAQAIWDAKPAGVRSYDGGSGLSGTAVDSTGASHTVGFNRATQDVLYVAISVKIDSTKFPSDGDAQIEALLAAEGNALGVGAEVELNELASRCLEKNGGIAGVKTFTLIKCDTNPVPTNTADIATLATHIPRFDATRVAVTHV